MGNIFDEREELQKWSAAWDKISEQIAKETAEQQAKAAQHVQSSFFSNTPIQNQETEEADPSWNDLYHRAQKIYGNEKEEVLTEIDWDKGEDGGEVRWGGKPPAKSNPNQYTSVGPDQSPRPYKPLRVSDNWADSEALRELDEIKRKVEQMEREFHTAEVKDKPSEGIKKELEGLRTRIEDLSEIINREPENDVT